MLNALPAAHSCPAIAKLPIWAGVSPIALTLVTLSLPTLVLPITPSSLMFTHCAVAAHHHCVAAHADLDLVVLAAASAPW